MKLRTRNRIFKALCITVSAGMLAACGSTSTPESSASDNEQASTVQSGESAATAGSIDFDEAPYELNVCYPVTGEAQPDLALIEERLNEIALAEINATVELEPISLSSMANAYALKASSQEKMDLLCMLPGYRYMSTFANSNLIAPLGDELETWGQDIIDVMGDQLQAGVFQGEQYCIPENNLYKKKGNGFYFLTDMAEKYGIDIASMQDYDDVEAALQIIKENEPEVIPLMPESVSAPITTAMQNVDMAGTGYIYITEEDGKLVAKCYIESDEYMENAIRVHDWYEKGYISRDVTTTQDNGTDLQNAGKCFAISSTSVIASMGQMIPIETDAVMFESGKPILYTQNDQLVMWGIAASCKRPDKAMQFLNLCFSSAEVTNLMKWGVEGVHYEMQDDGSMLLTNTAGWRNPWTLFGDEAKLNIRTDVIEAFGIDGMTTEDYRNTVNEWNESIPISASYGFTFDNTNVKTEVSACDNVMSQYTMAVGNGTVDPTTEIPKCIQELYDAGLQTILDEMQSQLDAWQSAQA